MLQIMLHPYNTFASKQFFLLSDFEDINKENTK
jgi:hypothetical protein